MRDTSLESAYTKGLMFADQMLSQHDPLEVAAVMSAIALSLYKTVLPEEDFYKIMDTISESRYDIKSIKPSNIQ